MKFYIDEENANQNYSYATFEESIGGRPLFIFKKEVSLIIPVINQGIYDLASFNDRSQIPIYCDKSYYLFKGVSECVEDISIRARGTINGEFEKKFHSNAHSGNARSYYIELEMGFNGQFTYGGVWRVKATEFGVLIPENANQSKDEKAFSKEVEELSKDDLDFLLNERQPELEDFVETL
jgi:hypothetical protein